MKASTKIDLIVGSAIIIFYCVLIYNSENKKLIPTVNKAETCMVYPSNELTKENVYAEIMRCDIKFSEIVLRQALLETGHFTSKNCLVRQNLFGLKGGEKTDDNPNGYKIFNHWRESVQYYKSWQQQRITEDCADYYLFLTQWKYAESPEYENKLKSIDVKVKI